MRCVLNVMNIMEEKSKKSFRSEAVMMPKAVPLAGREAASLLTCVCIFGVCHAHAEYWCMCSLAAVVTNINGIPLNEILFNKILLNKIPFNGFLFAYHTNGIPQAV